MPVNDDRDEKRRGKSNQCGNVRPHVKECEQSQQNNYRKSCYQSRQYKIAKWSVVLSPVHSGAFSTVHVAIAACDSGLSRSLFDCGCHQP